MADAKLSIVLPVHNQADHITTLVDSYVAALREHPHAFEILLVANGCTDHTVERCGALSAHYDEVRVLEIADTGWGRAVRHGLAAAQGDLLCYTNSARTSAETLTLMLLYAVVYPAVVLKANRRVRESLRRRSGSLLYNLECRTLFDLSVWDINGTPKIFPRSFDKLLRLTRDDDLIDLEFNLVCKTEGYPVLEIPILASRRHGGKSTTNYRSAFNMYVGAYRLSRRAGR
jgi:glycosyltransferase involved in cell wall biosynthesis